MKFIAKLRWMKSYKSLQIIVIVHEFVLVLEITSRVRYIDLLNLDKMGSPKRWENFAKFSCFVVLLVGP